METDPSRPDRCWRIRPALPALKLTAAALMVLAGLLLSPGDRVRLGLAVLTALALLGWGVRDLLVPVRLTADPAGVTVITGFAGRRRLPWSRIERISVESRAHLGMSTQTLEIDTGESLHVFTANDLGAPPDEVASALQRGRARSVGEHPQDGEGEQHQ